VNFRQVLILRPEFLWIKAFPNNEQTRSQPRLLAPMVKMLAGRGEGSRISALAMRAMLDGIRLRLDESRDLSRYMSGLLVFLGLLGTFWGLLDTISGVVEVIKSLSHQNDDLASNFTQLTQQLQVPLSGMSTAFSSSLFGLSGALIIGFLDLQSGHSQNRFYNDLEEWLSELAHLPSGSLNIEGGNGGVSSYIEALLEQTADNLNNLQRNMDRGEENRQQGQKKQLELAEKLTHLTDQLATRLGETQSHNENMNQHLHNIDSGINRLLGELSKDRAQFSQEVRDEVRLLARTLARKGPTE
ncbi:MAG: flagellar motor protein MotA, partial [Gammaproteobacteria bacterium]|nr:flagellar motor protein MotA [Gammaproteobacteria bacterium]